MSLESTHFEDVTLASSPAWNPSAERGLNVVLAEEAEILREGLKVTLRALDRQIVIHEAASWDELLMVSGQVANVDLLVVDEGLIPAAGEDLSTLRDFTANAPAVVVTGAESGNRMRCLIRQGARGYLSKNVGSRVFAGALKFVLDGGTYTVLVEGDDMTEPVADETRSILDGHIVLSRKLAAANHYPAIDILASASRVMGALASPEHKAAAGRVRELLAKYDEIELLLKVGEYKRGADRIADVAIERRDAINAFLRQPTHELSDFDATLRQLRSLTA